MAMLQNLTDGRSPNGATSPPIAPAHQACPDVPKADPQPELAPETFDWLTSNFFRTELELGHCPRLLAEGPSECDLFLTCAKFITISKYPPRLRDRYATELELAHRARGQGWTRVVEHHESVARRIRQVLANLNEPPVRPGTRSALH